MGAVVVVESCFGNTVRIARALAEGLGGAEVVAAHEAPDVPDEGVDLVLAGAPTHALKLPSPRTRGNAGNRRTDGAAAYRSSSGRPSEGPVDAGLAEWIERVRLPAGVRVVTFDTSIRTGAILGCAAKDAAKRLKRSGVAVERGESFWVTPKDVLVDGELERATAWAAGLS